MPKTEYGAAPKPITYILTNWVERIFELLLRFEAHERCDRLRDIVLHKAKLVSGK